MPSHGTKTARKPSKWNILVKKTAGQHKGKTFAQIIAIAKRNYKG